MAFASATLATMLIATGTAVHRELSARNRARVVRESVASGRFAEAQGELDRWLRERPGDPEARFLQARIALGRDRPAEADDALREARTLGHPEAEVDRLRALLLVRVGRLAEAEPALRRAWEAAKAPDPEVDRALARVFLETYRLSAAAQAIGRWMRDAPDDPRPYLWRVEISKRSGGEPGPLIRDFREALKRDPDLEEARLGLAEALLNERDLAGAAEAFQAVLARRPDHVAAHIGLGRVASGRGDGEEAIRHLDRALALAPGDVQGLAERASVDLDRGDLASAMTRLDRAARLDPNDLTLRYRRSLVLTRLGRHDEARAEREAVMRLREADARLQEIRADLIRSPQDVRLQGQAARWLIEQGHDEEGVRWAGQVLRHHPGDPDMSELMANYHGRRGEAGLANFYRATAISAPIPGP